MPAGRSGRGEDGAGSRAKRRIRFDFPNWDDFLAARLDVQPAGLFVPGSYDLPVGEDAIAHLTFPGDADGVRLSVRVLWRRLRAGSDPSVRAGVGLVVRSASLAAFRRLVEHAEGTAGLKGRRQERFDLHIPVNCTFGRRRPLEVSGEICDVSDRGVSARVAHRPSVDDAVFLRLDDPLLGTLKLSGFVTWVRGNAGITMSAIGVELQFPRDEDRKRWERIVGRAKAEARLSTEYSGD
jgi:Tfp pilus assembly protein PilZ